MPENYHVALAQRNKCGATFFGIGHNVKNPKLRLRRLDPSSRDANTTRT